MTAPEQPPKSTGYQAFEAALDAAQQQHQREQAARRAKRRPIGFALLLGGLALGASAVVMFVASATGGGVMTLVYGMALVAGSVTTGGKGISMIAGRG